MKSMKMILLMLLALLGMQSVWASGCEGDVYIKAPADWGSVWVGTQNHEPKQVMDYSNGYYHVNLRNWPQESYHVSNFSVGTFIGEDGKYVDESSVIRINAVVYLDSAGWGVVEMGDKAKLKNYTPFTCPGEGKELFIYENPLKPGYTVVSSNPPNAKYFFVLIPPDMTAWMSSVPMVSLDGGKTGREMKADPDKCGWYYYVFYDEIPTDDVVLYRAEDEERKDMLGMLGTKETEPTATPIPLNTVFSMVDSIYFVPDESLWLSDGDNGFYDVYPDIEGDCSYTLAAVIYDTDASLHGAFTCNPDWMEGQSATYARSNACAYPTAPYQIELSDGTIPCIGVTKGMVTDELDHTRGSLTYKKPRLTAAGKACFGSQADEAFTAMFKSTPDVNETYCVDMPFGRSKDGKWEFNSDNYLSPGATVPGGFYPAEMTPSLDRMLSAPLAAAENKRKADGPVYLCDGLRALDPNEGVPYGDLLCEGPGWAGGSDCSGLFAAGSEFKGTFNGVNFSGDGWGWSCPDEAPVGWNYYKKGTEVNVGSVEVSGQILASGDSRWTSGASDKTVLTGNGRNQHFCFESHAKFTYRKGLKFSFRGDDDIWVYIDNKLAVDLGGTHLAAPGYVNLDNFVGASGALVPEVDYDLDIFFCDRRTTMSNVRIKTNMYIRQKSDVTLVRDKSVTGSKSYNVCYTSSGDGSCAGLIAGNDGYITRCGDDILNEGFSVSYWLVEGRKLTEEAKAKPRTKHYDKPGVYNCVLDLTNFVKPTIGSAENICEIGTGRYTLFMEIDEKSVQIATFRPQGDVDVVYREAVAKDTSTSGTVLGKFSPKTVAMAGEWVPVYISNVHEPEEAANPLEVFPQDVVGMQYTLNAPGLKVCLAFAEDGSCARLMNENSSTRTIGPSGVDTVYVTVDAKDLTASTDFKVNVVGKATSLTITFFLPTIMFIEAIPEEGKLPVQKTGEVPNTDGSYEEFWVGSTYDFYLGVFKPDANGGLVLCPECELTVHRGNGTSDQVMFEESTFKNGYATISVISTKEYRSSLNNPAIIEVSNEQGYAKAQYTPVFFKEAPVSTPRLADVFDVRGANPSEEFNIPAPYFSMNQEYLDGIADSVVIYYHHSFHKDSLPTRICIAWDSSLVNVDSLWHNPYKEGFSTVKKDTSIFCNVLLSKASKYINCSSATDSKPYCSNKVKIGGLKLSANVKTGGSGKVISYAKFVEEDASGKKKEVKQGFSTNLIDRVAPVPLSAELFTYKSENVESLVVTMSEPVKLNSESMSVLDFYLNSAADLKTESSRYASKINSSSVVKATSVTTVIDTANQILVSYNRSSLYPDVGDYVRLTGNLKNVYWSDRANINVLGSDSLRDASADEKYHWNSPTAYDETKRLPSPWVAITGGACRDCNEDDIVYGKPSFRVKMVGPFKFAIVMNDNAPKTAKSYAVMDMQGRILHQGKITSTETVLPVLSSGSYIVKVGLGTRRVNIR